MEHEEKEDERNGESESKNIDGYSEDFYLGVHNTRLKVKSISGIIFQILSLLPFKRYEDDLREVTFLYNFLVYRKHLQYTLKVGALNVPLEL